MTPRPESILPPAVKLTAAGYSAALAVPLTIVVAVVAWALSFWLAHGAGWAQMAIASIFVWPAYVAIVTLGQSGLPEVLLYIAAVGAEYLYLWGMLFLVIKTVANYKARAAQKRTLERIHEWT